MRGSFFSPVAIRYEDFFGGKKERGSKRKAQVLQESKYSEDEDDMEFDNEVSLSLSIYIYILFTIYFVNSFLNFLFYFITHV